MDQKLIIGGNVVGDGQKGSGGIVLELASYHIQSVSSITHNHNCAH